MNYVFQPSKSCPQYFKLIERHSIQWCFGIGHKTNWAAMNQSSASMVCQHLNATITGLETVEELELAKEGITQYLSTSTIPYQGIGAWIDGKRKSATGEFQFEDPYLKQHAGSEWYLGQQGKGDCVRMMVFRNTSDSRNGKLFTVNCTSTSEENVPTSAVICGTPAK
ncbi:hypothetical protein B9Z55_016897 [Caenorhabditis nigoni]|uniref:C-type lectin domain-containing protein n=1 Tax=Caenorhabditis nigoni TaxID=1611254 RepID=A0A2G5T6P6_9PELO|nr:hypothetical protein B9Z55_016897 [Caenorhabditis nigoni]